MAASVGGQHAVEVVNGCSAAITKVLFKIKNAKFKLQHIKDGISELPHGRNN
jgi:hypothetical protein